MQIHKANANMRSKSISRSGGQHRVPDLGCSSILCAKLPEFELAFSNPMHKLDAGDRNRRALKSLEPKHRTKRSLMDR